MGTLQDKKLRPTIHAQSQTAFALESCKGKTISDWEFGSVSFGNECHQAERIILHFTDGTKLRVDIGSNAYNVASQHKGLRPTDIHTDLMAVLEK